MSHTQSCRDPLPALSLPALLSVLVFSVCQGWACPSQLPMVGLPCWSPFHPLTAGPLARNILWYNFLALLYACLPPQCSAPLQQFEGPLRYPPCAPSMPPQGQQISFWMPGLTLPHHLLKTHSCLIFPLCPYIPQNYLTHTQATMACPAHGLLG